MIDIFATVIIMVYMKTYMKAISVGFCFFCIAALGYTQNGTVLFRQTVKVNALSDGIEKNIYSTIGKEKVENQLLLTVTAGSAGDIEIRSDSFKLGKMPFSSLFYCVIPADLIQRNTDGAYVLDNLSGVYKVAVSKSEAVLTGTLDMFTCNLTLAVNGMGKKLTLQLSSNIDDSMDEEDEKIPSTPESSQ